MKFLWDMASEQNRHIAPNPAKDRPKEASVTISAIVDHYFDQGPGPVLSGFIDNESGDEGPEAQSPSLLDDSATEEPPSDSDNAKCIMLKFALLEAWHTYVNGNQEATFGESLDHLKSLSLLAKVVVWPV